jgi:hypothetical protein
MRETQNVEIAAFRSWRCGRERRLARQGCALGHFCKVSLNSGMA